MTTGSMVALAIEGFDHPPTLVEVPVPEPGAAEVRVRATAASVNAYDLFVAAGAMKEYLPHDFPVVLGQDVAGVVDALGDGAEGFQLGDRVFGTLGMKPSMHDGTFAEFSTPQAGMLARMPQGLGDEQAGSLGVAGTTAASAVDAVAPSDGAVVFVLGATGGVGTFAIQLAAARGAHVVASIRPGDEGFVTDLGAAETVDYSGDLAAAIRERHPGGIDAVIDLVNRNPNDFAALTTLVRDGGHAASAVGGAGEATSIGGVAVANVGSDPARLEALADQVVAGTLRVAIRRTYPLAEAPTALSDFVREHTLGKLVISMPER